MGSWQACAVPAVTPSIVLALQCNSLACTARRQHHRLPIRPVLPCPLPPALQLFGGVEMFNVFGGYGGGYGFDDASP